MRLAARTDMRSVAAGGRRPTASAPRRGHRSSRRVLPMGLLLALSWAPLACAVEAPPEVTVKNARLSVTARGASLKTILEMIGRAGGITVVVDPSVEHELGEDRTMLVLAEVPLEEGLRRLVRPRNVVFVYSPMGLAEVKVYAAGAAAGAVRPPS